MQFYDVCACEGQALVLGRLGENLWERIIFDVGGYIDKLPDASVTLINRLPKGTDAYPVANAVLDGMRLIWTITNTELTQTGIGECELIITSGDRIAKSIIWQTYVSTSLDGSGEAPEPWESWQAVFAQLKEDAERAAAEAEASADSAGQASTVAESAAETAQTASEAAIQSAESASESAASAAQDAQAATAKATEASQSATAAQAAQNAAETASGRAVTAETNAANSATQAAQSASQASTSATNAQTAATAASTKASEASANATTAATKATEAATSAQNAQGSANSAAAAQSAAETAQSAAETAADEAESSADDAQEAKEAAETLMIFPAVGGDAAAVATVTDAANDQPMALKIGIEPVQAGSGTPSPENVRPISGWTGAVIRRSGSDTSNPTVYSIDFPTAAGTVYGGTLEIAQDGTGTLTVDTTYIELTGDYSWGGAGNTGYDGEVGTNRYIEFASNNLPVPLLVDSSLGQNGKAIRACDRLRVQLGPIWANDTNNNVINFNAQTQVHIRLANATIGVESTADGATRTAAFKAWLTANPVHVAYQIATPQTYALTVEQVKSLLGINNVWADCGSTQITAYYADKTVIITAAEQRIENLTVSSETLPAGSQATVEKTETANGINLAFGIPKGADGQSGGVTDVQVNGTSVVTDGVANVPVAASGTWGVTQPQTDRGIATVNGKISISPATDTHIKDGNKPYFPVCTAKQHTAAFYGLAKAAGDTTQSASSNAVGNYTETAKSKISEMLSAPVSVTGTTPTITALSGIQYVCGEVATLDITLPASGIVDVVFESGSTPTVLTITPPTGMTVEWANGFDSTSLEADTMYELNIKMVGSKCLGVAGQWS